MFPGGAAISFRFGNDRSRSERQVERVDMVHVARGLAVVRGTGPRPRLRGPPLGSVMLNTVSLYHAFDEGDFDKINSFVNANGVNWRTEGDKWNLLHMALLSVSEAPRPDVVRHLIELGVEVNAKDWRRWTPLHFAARTNNAAAVKLLIDAGADVNAEDDEGITPVHQNLWKNKLNLEIIEMLLAAGAKQTHNFRKFVNAVALPDKSALLDLLAKYDMTCPRPASGNVGIHAEKGNAPKKPGKEG